MSSFLLQTKFYIPTSRPELVSRARLIEHLNRGLRRKLTLVSAPAGFGKTTLLSDWSRHCELPFAWLSLDEGDNDLRRFLSYVVAALQTITTSDIVMGEAVQEALHIHTAPLPPVEALLTALINDIATSSDAFVLVLDDYHLIDSPQIDHALTFLLNHAPPQLHLAIATRVDPSLPLSRLRARGQLTELRTAELRFTPAEAALFLKLVTGLEISAADVAALERRTEGWIAGLQLAALSMQGTHDISGFIESFTGTHRYIIDYLADEVLQQCTESVKSFLLHTSILNRLCGELCDALTGESHGQALLQQLEQANLFLVPLDNQRRWYRYHHLFADLLRQRLQDETTPERVICLHKRASQWYEGQNLLSQALHHALAVEDFARAAKLMGRKIIEKIMQGEISMVREWLQALPEDVVHNNPILCVSQAWICYFSHQYDAIEPLLQLAEQKSKESLSVGSISFSDLLGGAMALRAFIANQKGQINQAIGFLRQSLAHLPTENVFARGMSTFFLANTLFYNGNTPEASQLYPEAITLCLAAGNILAATGAIQSLAMSQMTQGRLHQALGTLSNALAQLDTPDKPALLAISFLYLGLAEVHYQQNDLAEAHKYVQKGLELLNRSGTLAIGLGYLRLAQVLHALGDSERARHAAQKAEEYYRKMESSSRDAVYAATHHARCLLLFGELASVARWAQESNIHAAKPLTYHSELELMIFAHLLIAQHAAEPTRFPTHIPDALTLLEKLYHYALTHGRMGRVIEILVLQALAYAAQTNTTQAVSVLEQALILAEPEGFVRVFVDKGRPMAVLLYETAARGINPRYIGRLLGAFPDIDPISPSESTSNHQNASRKLVEPLSERELEVLYLIADGLTNREIANKLILSLNTVKGHTRKIYGKLGVNSRTQAIGKARAFGLLTLS